VSFRTRTLVIFTGTLVAVIALVTIAFTLVSRKTWRRIQDEQFEAIVGQFHREFDRRGDEIVRAVEAIAESEAVMSIAAMPDYAAYYDEAGALAASHRLELLELVASDGTIISSAQWPARFGYREDWLARGGDFTKRGAVLCPQLLPSGMTLALIAVRAVSTGGRPIYVLGGQQLGQEFISTLVLPRGTRVLLWRDLGGGENPILAALAPLIDRVRTTRSEAVATIGSGVSETFHALPLEAPDKSLLGALLIGSRRDRQIEAERLLRRAAAGIGLAAVAILFFITAITLRGYDVFVSYRRSEASAYAARLVSQLQTERLRCFLDTQESPAGADLTPTIRSALRCSRFMVIILSPGVTQSRWIGEELAYFTATKGKNVIPISVDDFLDQPGIPSDAIASLREVSYLEENGVAVQSGNPSPTIVPAILHSYSRIRTSARMIVTGLIMAFLIVTVVLVWLTVRQA
jgi:hypothetical protein